ncbi:MAG: tRNA uridine-5-carboxymethylaminomethyl(34) synthesis enzyme MnmG [Tidjanibacter sp.]|nr:tRNA uridine-5-carboxymethylaminomethyl(34) synthesis enzyme MnmG [Tidjanibacter sp.]
MRFDYDVIVIGGGHAGCEAAAAAANLGAETLLITMDMTKYASMSCNPAVGGVAKGQIVREIDALGGQMGIITDRSTIQFRMLNRSKGAAMWSPRAQCDKARFSALWRETLENTPHLKLWQDTVNQLIVDTNEQGVTRVCGVVTALGVTFNAKSVVLTAGTFLGGLMHVGRNSTEGGRAGDSASHGVTEQLVSLGFEAGRMKTGTPVRIDARSLDLTRFERQEGDAEPSKFSFLSKIEPVEKQLPCYLVYTSKEVHDTLRTGFGDSPLFQGLIKGIGPRYCPSIEDKLRTFADKEFHQLFLEPEGDSTNEYYLNGFSSSLPWQVQIAALSQIEGFEQVDIYRPGYAIEYDYFPPTQLHHTLETKLVENLYFAGQINGTTGYEEAAAQGLMAGINAVRKGRGEEPVILSRDEAYIGVLIDDLVTKGVDEPYRMFTSRAEYRILLRQDNADLRLTPIAQKIGLATAERMADFEQKKSLVESLKNFVHKQGVAPAEISDYLKSVNSAQLTQKRKLSDLLIRNEIFISDLIENFAPLKKLITKHNIGREVIEQVEIEVKYSGYIEREKAIADKLKRLEEIRIPANFDFQAITSITIEARQKLSRIQPTTIGQASRIPGVSPADINILLIHFGR